MKKRICSAAAALACAFALAGCGTGIGDLAPENAVRGIRSEPLSALDGYTVTSVDGEGIVRGQKVTADGSEYVLYDTETQRLISSDTVFIGAGYGGMYYTASGSGNGAAYTYDFYDGAELVCTVTQNAEFVSEGGVISFADGNILYKGLNGEVYYGQRQGYEPVATEANTVRCGDCYLMLLSEGAGSENAVAYAVYDGGGKYLRTLSPQYEAGKMLPSAADVAGVWQIGTRVFVQARWPLPADAAEYDVFSGAEKYDTAVFAYDVLSGETERIDGFGWLVSDVIFAGENAAVLLASEILEGGQLSSASVAQCFGEDGGVFVDLQALLPGARNFEAGGGYAALTDGVRTAYFRGDDLLATLSPASDAEWLGAGWLRRVSDPSQIMNAAGETVLTLPENASLPLVYENHIYYTVTESTGEAVQYVFDAGSGQTEKLDGYFSDEGLALYGFYLAQNAEGGRTLYDFSSRSAALEGLGAEASVSVTAAAEGNEQYCVVTVAEGDALRNHLVVREYDKEL